MRIKRFLESVGGGWREVGQEEMERVIVWHKVDDITDREIEKVINTLISLDRISGKLFEYIHNDIGQLTLPCFNSSPSRMVKYSMFGEGAQDSYNSGPDNRRNNFLVKFDKLPGGVKKYMDIFKSEDDMFFVMLVNEDPTLRFFVCDQLDGLLSLLREVTVWALANP
jgi:hypothetical protein